jgi:hypothetical protein
MAPTHKLTVSGVCLQMRVNRTPVGKRRTGSCVSLTVLVASSLVGLTQAQYEYTCTSHSQCGYEGCNDRNCSYADSKESALEYLMGVGWRNGAGGTREQNAMWLSQVWADYCINGKWKAECIRGKCANAGGECQTCVCCAATCQYPEETPDGGVVYRSKCPCTAGCSIQSNTCRAPKPCPAGQYSIGDAKNGGADYACRSCEAGKYSGKYSAGKVSAGSSVCTDCVAGKYQGLTAQTSADTCFDCGAGKYQATAGSTVCDNCQTGTYVNVTGATTCLECSRDSCPFPGTFELSSCTPETNKVCEVYVHNVPTIGKIVIACGQMPFVILICCMVFKFSKLWSVMGVGENWKWTVFSFGIGVNDVVSDFTTLSLIPIKNPFFLFWVSLTSLLCSVTACLVFSCYSTIKLSWSTRAFVFISGSAETFGQDWPEKWNSRVLLCFENLPQLVVQAILLYLQGSQGFTEWDWAIWFQTLVFSLLNFVIRLRKLGKDLWAKEFEMMEHGAAVAAAVGPVAAVL